MTKHKPPTAVGMAVRTAVILFVFVIVFTGLLAGAYLWTKPALEASAAEEKMKLIDEVLPRTAYDNELLKDTVALPASPLLGSEEETVAYRARKGGQPVALVLEAVAPDGYAGKIRLVLAVNLDGSIAGVRVTQHKETPGLGDYIEPKKDKNKERPWITQFNGLSYAARPTRNGRSRRMAAISTPLPVPPSRHAPSSRPCARPRSMWPKTRRSSMLQNKRGHP